MPIYNYKCSCGFNVDINRPMLDRDNHAECPQCGELMKRQWGVGGVVVR